MQPRGSTRTQALPLATCILLALSSWSYNHTTQQKQLKTWLLGCVGQWGCDVAGSSHLDVKDVFYLQTPFPLVGLLTRCCFTRAASAICSRAPNNNNNHRSNNNTSLSAETVFNRANQEQNKQKFGCRDCSRQVSDCHVPRATFQGPFRRWITLPSQQQQLFLIVNREWSSNISICHPRLHGAFSKSSLSKNSHIFFCDLSFCQALNYTW